MGFPDTRASMKAAGYDYIEEKTCPCGARMELWRTPNGAAMPMDPMSDDQSEAKSHFATCPLASSFRRARPADAPPTAKSPKQTPPQTPSGHDQESPPSSATPATLPGLGEPDTEG